MHFQQHNMKGIALMRKQQIEKMNSRQFEKNNKIITVRCNLNLHRLNHIDQITNHMVQEYISKIK